MEKAHAQVKDTKLMMPIHAMLRPRTVVPSSFLDDIHGYIPTFGYSPRQGGHSDVQTFSLVGVIIRVQVLRQQ